jgi:pimeloyl-ACP methyl ester carboxylesterase
MRKWLLPLVVCVSMLFSTRSADAGWRDYVSPSKNWQRVKDCTSAATRRVTTYCRTKVDRAKADQAKMWGLRVPADLSPSRPLVLCVHGMDSTAGVFDSMSKLLTGQGYQVAYFSYPSDGPVQASADLLADEMARLHRAYPSLRVHLIGHSMGGMVARAYIEGDQYTMPVDRFVAIAPPNHGSPWTSQRWLIEVNEHMWLWRCEKDWSPIWIFTDGCGEAGDDMKPGSAFLTKLNERPRRAGVRYTIVVGDHHILSRFGANALSSVEARVPKKHWWGTRQTAAALRKAESKLEDCVSTSDGVVPLESARLDGVDDIVRLHADHNALCLSDRGREPAAWGVIRERLAR